MICATENSAVIDASIYDEFVAKMQAQGAYMVPKKITRQLKVLFSLNVLVKVLV